MEASPITGDMLVSSGCSIAILCTVSTIDEDGGSNFSTSPAGHGRLGGAAIAVSEDEMSKP